MERVGDALHELFNDFVDECLTAVKNSAAMVEYHYRDAVASAGHAKGERSDDQRRTDGA